MDPIPNLIPWNSIQFSDSIKSLYFGSWQTSPKASSENSSSTSLRGCHFRKETNHRDRPFHTGPNLQNSKSSLWKYRDVGETLYPAGYRSKTSLCLFTLFRNGVADWCWLVLVVVRHWGDSPRSTVLHIEITRIYIQMHIYIYIILLIDMCIYIHSITVYIIYYKFSIWCINITVLHTWIEM